MKIVSLIVICLLGACVPIQAPNFEQAEKAEALIVQGIKYLKESELERAYQSFLLSSELPETAAAVDGLGCVYLLRGNLTEAEKLFWRAYEMDKTYNNSLGNLALLYELKGDGARAQELFNKALEEDPLNFRMRNNYAVYLAQKAQSPHSAESELIKAQLLFNHKAIYDNINLLKGK